MNDEETGLERAQCDLELLQAAYPEEIMPIITHQPADCIKCKLKLSPDAFVELTFRKGYPTKNGIQVTSQQCNSSEEKVPLNAAVVAIRKQAASYVGEEHGLPCCAAAMEGFNIARDENQSEVLTQEEQREESALDDNDSVAQDFTAKWITGEPLTDRKSVFVAHVCCVTSERQVKEALSQLLDGNSKLLRATHNMYAWRVTEKQIIVESGDKDETMHFVAKHDNDDDGEDGAGSRLAHLLQMRREENVLVVVSRWFGGIHLGPKRFTHISNAAQQALLQYHETKDADG